jgi:flavodoxin
MKAVIPYESMYGNTRQIAAAVAAGLEPLGEVQVVSVNHGDAGAADGADVLIAGGPTHMHGKVIADPESFLVEDPEGPLAKGELDRARDWGASLADLVRAAA